MAHWLCRAPPQVSVVVWRCVGSVRTGVLAGSTFSVQSAPREEET